MNDRTADGPFPFEGVPCSLALAGNGGAKRPG